MSLPGKLCIGILEEDNPLRSYFRFKPLLIDEGGRYTAYEGYDQYPEDGCIRIVPDKNESYHFKSRMREMGLFCVVDLREHPGENDKIRPNKNYHPGGEEINGCIIYSDVVRTPVPGMIFEILPDTAEQSLIPTPGTGMVLLAHEDVVQAACYAAEVAEEAEGMARLKRTPAVCDVSALQEFDLAGFRGKKLHFAIKPAARMSAVCDLPEKRDPERPAPVGASERTIEKPEAVDPEKREAATSRSTEAPSAHPWNHAEVSAQPRNVEAPSDKPWIHHDSSMQPKPVDRRMSRQEQMMSAQVGLNPRRGRSLQEVIDEKWQHSRLNQLGMTQTPVATGAPVRNPVDVAVEVLKDVWHQPTLQRPLIEALGRVEDFMDSLRKYRLQMAHSLTAEQLNEMEAQRLELLGALNRLKTDSREVRAQLKAEIRRDEALELADAVEKTREAQARQVQYEQMARDAQCAARDAQALLDTLVGDQLEQKIRDVALIRRVEERLALLRGTDERAVPPVAEVIDISAFIERLTQCSAAEGMPFSRVEAANLAVCFALSPVLMLSGAPGSGKTTAARIIAGALGLAESNRAVMFTPGGKPVWSDERMKALKRIEDAPAAIILDNANLCPGPDPLRGMGGSFHPEWRTLLTLQDVHSGAPLNAAALDSGFMVRLTPSEELPWMPAERQSAPEMPLASVRGIADSCPRAEVPDTVIERMQSLRAAMARRGAIVSRRALDDAWRYCAAMRAILGDAISEDALFDRAVAQRILPVLLASAPIDAIVEFRRLVRDLPMCQAWLGQPLPISLG